MGHPSSASLEALSRYARVARGASARLEAEARVLDASLSHFQHTCTEYRVLSSAGTAGRLLAAARGAGELGAWVDEVAARFRLADAAPSPTVELTTLTLSREIQAIRAERGRLPRLGEMPKRRTRVDRAARVRFATSLIKASIRLVMGRPTEALFTLTAPALALLAPVAPVALAMLKEEFGFGELERAMTALHAELMRAMTAVAGATDRHGADAGVLELFRQLWIAHPALAPRGALAFDEQRQDAAWNAYGAALLNHLTLIENLLSADSQVEQLELLLLPMLAQPLLATGVTLAGLSVVGDAQHWTQQPISDSNDAADLIERSFWHQGFDHLDPELKLALAIRIDRLNTLLSGEHPPLNPNAPCVQPSNRAHVAYAAISYEPYEQVVLERLNGDGDYRLSIAGLDPSKPGAPNNLAAVVLTADFPPEQNHYYQHVRERLFVALEQMPPGSTLHLQGHSMGGAMCLLLRDDPEVQRRLSELGITVPSLTIYGAVAPGHADLRPSPAAGSPFAETDVRVYVNPSDTLALNVGADYDRFAEVHSVGGPGIDSPHHAHGDYQNPEHYADLPPELRLLPYYVDPASYERIVPQQPHRFVPAP